MKRANLSAPVPGGNVYDKYGSRNPVSAMLVGGFLRCFDGLVEKTQAREVFECGSGEGFLSLRLLRKGYDVRGCDIDAGVVAQANEAAARQGYAPPFAVRSVFDCRGEAGIADLVVCCEVLEHLEDPAGALEILHRLSRRWVLLSVPREPLWRMLNLLRLAYVRHLGNTPGHVQHWRPAAFRQFVARHFEIVEIRYPLPWVFLLCRKPARPEAG